MPCVEAVGCRSLSSEISLKGYGLTNSMVGCGFVVGGGLGGDIEWVVSSGGHKGVGLLFLLGEEKHTQRKRER